MGGRAAARAQPLLQHGRPRDPRRAARPAQRHAHARDHRGRPRPHRHRVAVAARGDLPQVRAHLRDPAAADGALPRLPLRLLAGAAVRVDPRPRARRSTRGSASASRSGQWLPVGGTWIEPDCNLPAGESLVRQFLHGQRFFEREFGRRAEVFWNPDVFGYNGQLPQIMRGAGHQRLPHPEAVVEPLHDARAPHVPLGRHRRLGGARALPARRHLQRRGDRPRAAPRGARLQGPRALGAQPAACSAGATAAAARPPRCSRRSRASRTCRASRARRSASRRRSSARWRTEAEWPEVVGELYLEYHRGTYTTQARTKRASRRAERALHDAELLAAVAGEPARRSRTRGRRCCSTTSTTSSRAPRSARSTRARSATWRRWRRRPARCATCCALRGASRW